MAVQQQSQLWQVKEAFRFCIEATDEQLAARGISREKLLSIAKNLDSKLPNHLYNDGSDRWADDFFNNSLISQAKESEVSGLFADN